MIFAEHSFKVGSIDVGFGGDIHVGIKGAKMKHAEQMFDYISDTPNMYYVGMGDYAEFREPGHNFFDLENVAIVDGEPMSIRKQLDWTFEQFEKVKKKTLGILIGNHERNLLRKTTMNPFEGWCKENDVPYLGDMGHLTLTLKDSKYTVLVHHGYGGGYKSGGKVNRLTDFIKEHDVDAVVIGHVHQLMSWISTELTYKKGEPQARYKRCGCSGCFMATYQKDAKGFYGEQMMASPVPLGYLVGRFDKKEGITMREVLVE